MKNSTQYMVVSLLASVALILSSCASSGSSNSDDYYSYSNSRARRHIRQQVVPPVDQNSNAVGDNTQTEHAATPVDTSMQVPDDSLAQQSVVDDYYANRYTPVITPWWNCYYSAWPSYRTGLHLGIGFGYSPWTAWSSWYDPYSPAPYFSWGWNWYTPWYSCNPYYGFGYDPYFSYGLGYRYAGWYSPWYVPHHFPEYWPGRSDGSFNHPRTWTSLHGTTVGSRGVNRPLANGQSANGRQLPRSATQGGVPTQLDRSTRSSGSVFRNPTLSASPNTGARQYSRPSNPGYRNATSTSGSVGRYSGRYGGGAATPHYSGYSTSAPRASFGGSGGRVGSSAPRGSGFSSHVSGGHRR